MPKMLADAKDHTYLEITSNMIGGQRLINRNDAIAVNKSSELAGIGGDQK